MKLESLRLENFRRFDALKGFSRANLMYMRAFAEAWPDLNRDVNCPTGYWTIALGAQFGIAK